MRSFSLLLVSLLGLAVLVGCASSDVTARRQASGSQDVAKPQRIIVHNFAGTPADLPPDSAIAEHYARRSQPQTAKEIEIGRKLGAQVAANRRKLSYPEGWGRKPFQRRRNLGNTTMETELLGMYRLGCLSDSLQAWMMSIA